VRPLDLAAFDGHTPGPWRAMSGPGVAPCIAGGEIVVAAVMSDSAPNAALLAAAPDLLAEVKRLQQERDVFAAEATSLWQRFTALRTRCEAEQAYREAIVANAARGSDETQERMLLARAALVAAGGEPWAPRRCERPRRK